MPLYDYHCSQCDARFEARHPIAGPVPPCPDCGAAPQQAFYAAPAVHGRMASGREQAVRALEPGPAASRHGPGCACCH